MKSLKKIGKGFIDFMGIGVTSISFIIIFITFLISIASRYIFKTPVTWSYELSVLGYIWTMFFGVGKAMEKDEHVVFGLVYDVLKPFGQFMCKILYNIVLVVLLLITFLPCAESLITKQMVTGVLKLPFNIIFLPLLWMFAEVIVRSVINIVNAVKEYKGRNNVENKEGGNA